MRIGFLAVRHDMGLWTWKRKFAGVPELMCSVAKCRYERLCVTRRLVQAEVFIPLLDIYSP